MKKLFVVSPFCPFLFCLSTFGWMEKTNLNRHVVHCIIVLCQLIKLIQCVFMWHRTLPVAPCMACMYGLYGLPVLWPIQPVSNSYLGQCKARPFNFVRVFYFLFFIFYFSALTDIGFSALKSRLIQIEPCTAVGPPLVLAMVHWPPMNKFACKLHGYIVYFIWWEANHIPSHSHAQNGIAIPVHFKCFRVCGKLFTCLVLLRQCQCFYCDAVGVSLYWIPHLPGTQKYKITISFHLLGDVDISASTNRSFVGHKV